MRSPSPDRRRRIALAVAATALALVAGCSGDGSDGGDRAAPATTTEAVAATTTTTVPAAGSDPRSLVIGIDGATFSRLDRLDLPNIDRVRSAGFTATSDLYAEPLSPTVSGPGWSTIATGVWPDRHGVLDNEFGGARFDEHPDYMTRLETADAALSTHVITTWFPLATTVFGPDVVDQSASGGFDFRTEEDALALLSAGDPDAVFLDFDDVDAAGHDHGEASPEYTAALEAVDARIGRVLDALEARPSYADEQWLVVLTADHGHTPEGGHGGSTAQERQTFVIAAGPGIEPGSQRDDVEIVDVAPGVLAHHGVTIDPAWELDGRPWQASVADDFDGLRPELRPAEDEARAGPDAEGWTTTPPEGWSAGGEEPPTGGAVEWRGWSFTTDDFWTATERDDQRETAVRMRDVFAVADADRWRSGTGADGEYRATLVTPAYDVAGASTITLGFASRFAPGTAARATVTATFDAGEGEVVVDDGAEVNAIVGVDLDVPDGAGSVRFTFTFVSPDDGFWAIDGVTVG